MKSESLLIFGGNNNSRKQKIEEILKKSEWFFDKNNPDQLIIEKEKKKNSLGIDQSRKIINFLSTKPYKSRFKLVVVYDAHLLTYQAQNALLKTLEEPPRYALIILEAKSEQSLIPTVVSRCKKIYAAGEYQPEKLKFSLEVIKKMDVGEKLNTAQEIAKMERDEVIALLEDFIYEERTILLNRHKLASAKLIDKLIEIANDIENTNVNLRLALENVFLEFE